MKMRKKFKYKIWSKLLPKWKINKPQVYDLMEEVNIDTMEEPKITYISSLLLLDLTKNIILIM